MAGKVWVPLAAWFSADPRWCDHRRAAPAARDPRARRSARRSACRARCCRAICAIRWPIRRWSASRRARRSARSRRSCSVSAGSAAGHVRLRDARRAAARWRCSPRSTWRAQSAVAFILAGTVLASLAGALTAFLISIAPNPYAVAEVIDWLMGALTDRSFADVRTRAAVHGASGCALLLLTGRALDALTLGEDCGALARRAAWARSRLLVVLGTGLAIGASVAVTGVVGFVGLIVPHLLRPVVRRTPVGAAAAQRARRRGAGARRRQPVPARARRGRGPARRRDGADRRALLPRAAAAAMRRRHGSERSTGVCASRWPAAACSTMSARRCARAASPRSSAPTARARSTLVKALAGAARRRRRRCPARRPRRRRASIRASAPGDRLSAAGRRGALEHRASRELVALGRLPHRAPFAGPSAARSRRGRAGHGRDRDRRSSPTARSSSCRAASAPACCWRACWRASRDWLLADEPLASLDPAHQLDILDRLRARRGGGAGRGDRAPRSGPGGARRPTMCCCCGTGASSRSARPREVLHPERLRAVFGVEVMRCRRCRGPPAARADRARDPLTARLACGKSNLITTTRVGASPAPAQQERLCVSSIIIIAGHCGRRRGRGPATCSIPIPARCRRRWRSARRPMLDARGRRRAGRAARLGRDQSAAPRARDVRVQGAGRGAIWTSWRTCCRPNMAR